MQSCRVGREKRILWTAYSQDVAPIRDCFSRLLWCPHFWVLYKIFSMKNYSSLTVPPTHRSLGDGTSVLKSHPKEWRSISEGDFAAFLQESVTRISSLVLIFMT